MISNVGKIHAEVLMRSGELALALMFHQLGLGESTLKERVLRALSNRESSQGQKIKFSNSLLHLCALIWILGTAR